MCAASSRCCVILAHALNLPGFVNEDGSQKYQDYADYITNHIRRPGVGPLAGFRMGENGLQGGRGDVNESQIDNYIENGGFWIEHVPENAAYYKPFSMDYQNWAVKMGFYDAVQPYIFQLYVEPMRKFQAAAEGIGTRQPPEHLRQRSRKRWTRSPSGTPRSRTAKSIPMNTRSMR